MSRDKPAPAEPAPPSPAAQGHPRGLYVLFFTEMWERFSYFGMRALLVLYMVNYLRWSQEHASSVYKWYTTLVYLTPLLGGYLADRYLGNKRAVILGASLMAAGQFMLTVDSVPVFYASIFVLILGNGMFKPNMSTQVGRLYAADDGRRDSAYTIFYMGVNLGAFIAPLVCGYLRRHYGFRWGFAAAGVGMLLGLGVYLGGLRWVKEVSGRVLTDSGQAGSEEPSALPRFTAASPSFVLGLGVVLLLGGALFFGLHRLSGDNLIGVILASLTCLIAGWILLQVRDGARERVMAIYALAALAIFFWAGFEQAGNTMNLWADQVTDRHLTGPAPTPPSLPEMQAAVGFSEAAAAPASHPSIGVWWHDLWNPVSPEWFQSINSLAIFLFAPLLAWLWTWLERRRRNPSIPTKMALGMLIMSISFGAMIFASRLEDRASAVRLDRRPPLEIHTDHTVWLRDPPAFAGQVVDGSRRGKAVPAQAGRLAWQDGQLRMRGVLSAPERDRILRASAPDSFVRAASQLAVRSHEAQGTSFRVELILDEIPPGFDLRWSGIHPRNLSFDAGSRRLTLENLRLGDKDYKALLEAAAHPALRSALSRLYVESSRYKVSAGWLLIFYLLATIGELCLSPVGLSMVSKLAPARFATMLMGLWFLMTSFGNFIAGALGESWGTMAPTAYFTLILVILAAIALVLFGLGRRVSLIMHGVR